MAETPKARRAPIRYELVVLGHLDPRWANWFAGLTLTQHDDGTTSLCGQVTDQAELHGLLAKVRDLGATLVSVTPADAAPADTASSQPEQTTSAAEPCAAGGAPPDVDTPPRNPA